MNIHLLACFSRTKRCCGWTRFWRLWRASICVHFAVSCPTPSCRSWWTRSEASSPTQTCKRPNPCWNSLAGSWNGKQWPWFEFSFKEHPRLTILNPLFSSDYSWKNTQFDSRITNPRENLDIMNRIELNYRFLDAHIFLNLHITKPLYKE